VLDSQDQLRFEMLVLPHLAAAFNPARWLLRSGPDAENAAQEAMLRAARFFQGFHGGDGVPGCCKWCVTPGIPGWR
jgi:DNA-directed RNA polymerase specialized sigma24 family protein